MISQVPGVVLGDLLCKCELLSFRWQQVRDYGFRFLTGHSISLRHLGFHTPLTAALQPDVLLIYHHLRIHPPQYPHVSTMAEGSNYDYLFKVRWGLAV